MSALMFLQLGSLLSIYGCYQYHNKVGGDNTEDEMLDPESSGDGKQMQPVGGGASQDHHHQPDRKIAGFWGYVFQIIFQVRETGFYFNTNLVFFSGILR